MISRCTGTLGAEKCGQSSPEIRLELASSLHNNSGGCAKSGNPSSDKGFGYVFSYDACERNGHRVKQSTQVNKCYILVMVEVVLQGRYELCQIWHLVLERNVEG